jgi:hypothetical protein
VLFIAPGWKEDLLHATSLDQLEQKAPAQWSGLFVRRRVSLRGRTILKQFTECSWQKWWWPQKWEKCETYEMVVREWKRAYKFKPVKRTTPKKNAYILRTFTKCL